MTTTAVHSDVLVDPDWVAGIIGDPGVRLIEVDVTPADYDRGHIPGAVLWNAYADLRRPDYGPVGPAELARLLSRSGVTPDTTIVFYGYAAHLGFWLMSACGHDHLRLLDGTRTRWVQTGHGWSTDVPTIAPTSYPSDVNCANAGLGEVQDMIGDPDHVILDVRCAAEYDGERFWPSGATEGAGRAGHIPGAVHVPIELLRTEDGAFNSTPEMRQVLRDHAVMPAQKVVTYCTIGNRASQAWFALQYLLGYPDATVYYGSWAEWGSRESTPVET